MTEGDAERREAALEFQRTVDGLFNFGGRRGEDRTRRSSWRGGSARWPGFSTDEIDEIAAMAAEQRAELAALNG